MSHHTIVLQWSDEDQTFIASVPELPGLSAFGDTPESAIKELSIAKKLFIESMVIDGESIPEPEVLKPFSGQLRLRLPKSLHASLTQIAQMECVSLNTYIISLLSERNAYQKVNKKIELLKSEVSTFQNWAMNTLSRTRVFAKTSFTWADPDETNIIPNLALSNTRSRPLEIIFREIYTK